MDYSGITLKSALAFIILIIGYKIFRLKCKSTSNCCGDDIHIDLENQSERQLQLPALTTPKNNDEN